MRIIIGLAFVLVGFAYLGSIVMDWSKGWQVTAFFIAILACIASAVAAALRDD